jgi:threonine aldolase
MKEAMMRAAVGDEQSGDDPTVDALCDRMAALTGKAAAMFLPTGTMCNQISILSHCRPGDEILAHESSHIIANEGGGPGALAGAVVLGLRGVRGMFDSATMKAALREKRRNAPPQTLVAVEQTANAGGGFGLAGRVADRGAVHRA